MSNSDRSKLAGLHCKCCAPVQAAEGESKTRTAVQVLAVAGLLLLIFLAREYGGRLNIPSIAAGMGYFMVFAVGLLNGLHCAGMCGSFIIGYSAGYARNGRPLFRAHLLYGAGKTFSYAVLGALFGLLGSLFAITPFISGLSLGLAGGFLILYGLNMLGVFLYLRSALARPAGAAPPEAEQVRPLDRGPLCTGLLSGLILGCGPLQAMYVMAAGTGSAVQGALTLALFGLGTLPALFCFGLAAEKLSGLLTRRFMQASGLILVALGIMMVNKGIFRAGGAGTAGPAHSCCHCPAPADSGQAK